MKAGVKRYSDRTVCVPARQKSPLPRNRPLARQTVASHPFRSSRCLERQDSTCIRQIIIESSSLIRDSSGSNCALGFFNEIEPRMDTDPHGIDFLRSSVFIGVHPWFQLRPGFFNEIEARMDTDAHGSIHFCVHPCSSVFIRGSNCASRDLSLKSGNCRTTDGHGSTRDGHCAGLLDSMRAIFCLIPGLRRITFFPYAPI